MKEEYLVQKLVKTQQGAKVQYILPQTLTLSQKRLSESVLIVFRVSGITPSKLGVFERR